MVLIKNTMEFSGVIKKKIMWNFPGVLVVLDLKISDGPNKFCGVSRVEASFLTGISRGNIKNLNIPKWFSKKYVLNPPSPVCIFYGITQLDPPDPNLTLSSSVGI